jgi:NAD(P)-dependent dehydrogenase (short-subunit alcohol dehydrogenase family)
VAILARDADRCEQVADEIRAGGGEAIVVAADVTSEASVRQASADLLGAWGHLDILVNAAGGNSAAATIQPDGTFFDIDVEAFRAAIDLNLVSAVLITRYFAPTMAEGGGSIINISSVAGSRPLTRIPGYDASKAALENFTRFLAVDLARRYAGAVRVNAIAPGFFPADQNRSLLVAGDGSPTPRALAILDATPMGRFGEPDDLVGTAIWLASDASRFVTGVVIAVDGGFSAWSGV